MAEEVEPKGQRGNRIITADELVREIIDASERFGAEHDLSEEQIAKLKYYGARMFSG